MYSGEPHSGWRVVVCVFCFKSDPDKPDQATDFFIPSGRGEKQRGEFEFTPTTAQCDYESEVVTLCSSVLQSQVFTIQEVNN